MKIHLIHLVLPFLLACGGKKAEETQTLSDEKISRIMADLYVAEAATTGLSGYSKDSLMKVYYLQVFELHGVTAESYEKDLRVVGNDLEHLKAVVHEAQRLLDGSQKKPEEPKK